jgi:hypothetical protein
MRKKKEVEENLMKEKENEEKESCVERNGNGRKR